MSYTITHTDGRENIQAKQWRHSFSEWRTSALTIMNAMAKSLYGQDGSKWNVPMFYCWNKHHHLKDKHFFLLFSFFHEWNRLCMFGHTHTHTRTHRCDPISLSTKYEWSICIWRHTNRLIDFNRSVINKLFFCNSFLQEKLLVKLEEEYETEMATSPDEEVSYNQLLNDIIG